MPRKSSAPNFEKIRNGGIEFASKLVIEHKYDNAKDVFTRLLEISPDDIEIMTLHANIYFVEGKLIEAERGLNQVLALYPDYPLALYFLGSVYHEKGEYEKAIHINEIADVYQNLGCSLWAVKRREAAIEAWKTCLKYNPRQRYARENLRAFTN